jgi:hypothetical protein
MLSRSIDEDDDRRMQAGAQASQHCAQDDEQVHAAAKPN